MIILFICKHKRDVWQEYSFMGNFIFCEVYCSPLQLNVLFPLKSNNFENGRRKEWMDKNLGEKDHETFFYDSIT